MTNEDFASCNDSLVELFSLRLGELSDVHETRGILERRAKFADPLDEILLVCKPS